MANRQLDAAGRNRNGCGLEGRRANWTSSWIRLEKRAPRGPTMLLSKRIWREALKMAKGRVSGKRPSCDTLTGMSRLSWWNFAFVEVFVWLVGTHLPRCQPRSQVVMPNAIRSNSSSRFARAARTQQAGWQTSSLLQLDFQQTSTRPIRPSGVLLKLWDSQHGFRLPLAFVLTFVPTLPSAMTGGRLKALAKAVGSLSEGRGFEPRSRFARSFLRTSWWMQLSRAWRLRGVMPNTLGRKSSNPGF